MVTCRANKTALYIFTVIEYSSFSSFSALLLLFSDQYTFIGLRGGVLGGTALNVV